MDPHAHHSGLPVSVFHVASLRVGRFAGLHTSPWPDASTMDGYCKVVPVFLRPAWIRGVSVVRGCCRIISFGRTPALRLRLTAQAHVPQTCLGREVVEVDSRQLVRRLRRAYLPVWKGYTIRHGFAGLMTDRKVALLRHRRWPQHSRLGRTGRQVSTGRGFPIPSTSDVEKEFEGRNMVEVSPEAAGVAQGASGSHAAGGANYERGSTLMLPVPAWAWRQVSEAPRAIPQMR